jgi:hypothetical protein
MENRPIIAGTVLIPAIRCTLPKLQRGKEVTFMPMIPTSRPSAPATSPLMMLLPARLPMMVSPNTAMRKYSAEPNSRDIFTSWREINSSAKPERIPPITLETVETPRALRPMPCWDN